MTSVKPGDRVLLLSPIPPARIAELARAAAGDGGIVVCSAPASEVHELRRELRVTENVMVVPAADEGSIPWNDEFFTVVYAPALPEPSSEVLRVLAPGGAAHTAGGTVFKR